jgi:hypothetical protein
MSTIFGSAQTRKRAARANFDQHRCKIGSDNFLNLIRIERSYPAVRAGVVCGQCKCPILACQLYRAFFESDVCYLPASIQIAEAAGTD